MPLLYTILEHPQLALSFGVQIEGAKREDKGGRQVVIKKAKLHNFKTFLPASLLGICWIGDFQLEVIDC